MNLLSPIRTDPPFLFPGLQTIPKIFCLDDAPAPPAGLRGRVSPDARLFYKQTTLPPVQMGENAFAGSSFFPPPLGGFLSLKRDIGQSHVRILLARRSPPPDSQTTQLFAFHAIIHLGYCRRSFFINYVPLGFK